MREAPRDPAAGSPAGGPRPALGTLPAVTPHRPPLSVVIPVHNEESSVEELHRRLRRSLPPGAEILFVDDGSTDGTRSRLAALKGGDPALRVLGFRRHFGKSEALAAGFHRAGGGVVVTLDGDLQDAPEEIPRLLGKLAEGYDLVCGWRRRRRDAAWKVLGSRLFNLLVGLLGGRRFRDVNCGLKALRREVHEEILLASGFHRFLPVLAHWRGFRVAEVEVEHHRRRHGKSRYGGERILWGLMDLVTILFLVRFTGRPGRYFAALGSVLTVAGLAVSTTIAYLRLAWGSIQSRFPLMALGLVLLVVGVELVSLGLFAELLALQFRSLRTFEPVVWEAPGPADAEPAAGEARADAAQH